MGFIGAMLKSRKFWVMVGGVSGCIAASNVGGAVAIVIAYISSVAVEDAAAKLGAGIAASKKG